MTGGLMQLVAYGAQDVFLTGDPSITFWKVVYRRHTNFAVESIQQTFSGDAKMGKKLVCKVDRNGDLMHRVFLQVDVDPSQIHSEVMTGDTDLQGNDLSLAELTLDGLNVPAEYLGFYLIEYIRFDIGGQEIDEQFGVWLHIWEELTLPSEHERGFKDMVGVLSKDLTEVNSPDSTNYPFQATPKTLYIPFQFWFNRNPGLAIPLIALQYHEVKFEVGLQSNSFFSDSQIDVLDSSGSSQTRDISIGKDFLTEASLWVDYVYLDTDERRRFAQMSHEYLIEQVQFTGDESLASKVQINFNHPIKELIWLIYDNDGNGSDLTPNGKHDFKSMKILLNSQDRFTERDPRYFNLVQPYQHHTRIPGGDDIQSNASDSRALRYLRQHLYLYSFSLKPEEHQPSGSCNFSRIDTSQLKFTNAAKNKTIKLFARSYNVLRVLSGLGGLAYAS